ncbi:RNA polymerase sigma factor [Sphingobacterium sp. SGR-19]|uniref:RNA polymerase sigma factor n=1 Tax=Sphingobacterium sp. SGR-19 TaxID=2710886 RepID=UPI0013EB66D0|nr:RNA polymerase sigma-70 factor [Sphingobacterium sp. SGR-19]NGM67179.1 RNA polymerase sigma-70 factor [Sphingobacterium sp. SGR-19]
MKKSTKLYVELSEIALLDLVKQDDQGAFRELYNRYSGKLYGNILRMTKSKDTADDILQSVFIKIWENRFAIDTMRSFKSFIYQIAQNTVFDNFRKEARLRVLASSVAHQREELEQSESPTEKWIGAKEYKTMLENAVSQLPPRRREIYQLCKLEGLTYDQVSEIMGISTSTINDHIVKASKALREHLTQSRYYTLLLLFFIF